MSSHSEEFEKRSVPTGFRSPAIRIPINLPVQFTGSEEGSDLISGDTTLNLSQGGMFIKTNHYVRPGKSIRIRFSLGPEVAIDAVGRVAWASEGVEGNQFLYARGLGIQFTSIPQGALQQIKSLADQYHSFP